MNHSFVDFVILNGYSRSGPYYDRLLYVLFILGLLPVWSCWHLDSLMLIHSLTNAATVVVCDRTTLENKCIFSTCWYVLFLICRRRKKMIRNVCTLHYEICYYSLAYYVVEYDHMIILELLACGWCWYEWVHPVSMYAHSRLLLPLRSTVKLFMDNFTLFLQLLFGLAVLDWALGWWFPIPHMHTCCYKLSYHIHS